MNQPKRWPHQLRALEEFEKARDEGHRRIVVAMPTGMGKTVFASDCVERCLSAGGRAVVYTNRRLLLEQLSGVFTRLGMPHGIRAADYFPEHDFPLQVSSIPTENQRVFRTGNWKLHPANLVVVDEAHMQKEATARKVIDAHVKAGATVLGLTATPIDLAAVYTKLVQAGVNSDGYACGALVRAVHYGVDEPDLSRIEGVRLSADGGLRHDLSEEQQRRAMGALTGGRPDVRLSKLVGRVFEWYRRINPTQAPSILFAPGVKESVWFAEQFSAAGVPAAHIDGDEIWINGEFRESTRENRDYVLRCSEHGSIKVLCNRFVLREGIDAPWLSHGIFATVFGSLQTYLQSGGRLLRACPGLSSVTIQDHGGNWHRHGSLNDDRHWELGVTAAAARGDWLDKWSDPDAAKPFLCPGCQSVLVWKQVGGRTTGTCPHCGHGFDFTTRSRPVIQDDGVLVHHEGDPVRPRPIKRDANTETLWERVFWKMRNAQKPKTFRQAYVYFCHEYGYWPPKTLKFMPIKRVDWFRHMKSVPVGELRRESS